jgi:hypothetical protein
MSGENVKRRNGKMTELKEGTCCLCKHPLSSHIDEGSGWRCHILGDDLYQCECFLRKGVWRFDSGFYDLKKRINRHKKEMENDVLNSSTVKHTDSSKGVKDGGAEVRPRESGGDTGVEGRGLEGAVEEGMEYKRPDVGGGSAVKDKGMDEED